MPDHKSRQAHGEGASACGPGALATLEIPLLGPEWFEAAVTSFELRSACDDSSLPLVRRKRLGIPWLEFAGARELYEPMQLPLAHDQLGPALQAMRRQGLPICLQRLPATDPLASTPTRLFEAGFRLRTGGHSRCVFTDTSVSWDTYLAGRSPKRRSDLRRFERRAEAMGDGPVKFEAIQSTDSDFPALFERFVDVENSNWKGRRGSSLAKRPVLREFFRRLGEGLSRRGELWLFFLGIGTRTAAAQFCLLRNERLWTLKVGYDDDFARCSPGLLLTARIIQYACQTNINGYEFLGTDEDWVQPWATGGRALLNLYLFPTNFTGLAALAGYDARHTAARFKRQSRGD